MPCGVGCGFALVKHVRGGTNHDVTPAPFNARSRVHEYGGGAVLVDRGVVFLPLNSDIHNPSKTDEIPLPGTPFLHLAA